MTAAFDPSWTAVEAAMARIVRDSPEPFDPATVANGADLVARLRADFAATWVEQGYWPTFQIGWPAALDLEVFADRIEVYRPVTPGASVDVWEEFHSPGQAFSDAFVTELMARVPRGA